MKYILSLFILLLLITGCSSSTSDRSIMDLPKHRKLISVSYHEECLTREMNDKDSAETYEFGSYWVNDIIIIREHK